MCKWVANFFGCCGCYSEKWVAHCKRFECKGPEEDRVLQKDRITIPACCKTCCKFTDLTTLIGATEKKLKDATTNSLKKATKEELKDYKKHLALHKEHPKRQKDADEEMEKHLK